MTSAPFRVLQNGNVYMRTGFMDGEVQVGQSGNIRAGINGTGSANTSTRF